MSNGKLQASSKDIESEGPTSALGSPAPSLLPPNPFADLEAMRLSQDFAADTRVRKLLTTVPVRKPSQQDFFRVNPDLAYQLPAAAIIELKDDREIYFVHPAIAPEVVGEYRAAMIVTTINRQGVLSIWPLKLPSPDGRKEEWLRSALEAAERATTRWNPAPCQHGPRRVRNFRGRGQDARTGLARHRVPGRSSQIAFRDRLIDSADHPVIKRLRGAS